MKINSPKSVGKTPVVNGRGNATIFLAHFGAFLFVVLAASLLRRITLQPDAILQGYLQIVSGLLAFVFAAVTLVRFQGTQDRISLILGAGFLLSGAVLTATSVLFFQFFPDTPRLLWAPVAWWLGRMVLALLLVVALLVEHFLPRSPHPRREIAGALLTVITLTYMLAVALRRLPPQVSRHPGAFFPNPEQLLPAAIFLTSLIWYRRRLSVEDSEFDRTMYAAAWLNVAAQLSAAQSARLLDAPFVFAQALMVLGYTVALGGALLDNARLFEQVHQLAVSDSLTGLANYRRLLDVLQSETLVGSRAICRLAEILRIHCRAVDTAARYGGDEFALVLPESHGDEANRVANRIREVLANDGEEPPLSASIGISIYRGDGERIEKLLSQADQDLYAEKARRGRRIASPPGRRDSKS